MNEKNYTTEKDGRLYDNCVICKNVTSYLTEQHIDTRYHYIEGIGQLCKKCYDSSLDVRNK